MEPTTGGVVRGVRVVDAVAVAAIAMLVVAPMLLAPFNSFDGGITASSATFGLHGLLPYRDFWLLYGPLSGWLTAIPLAVFGPSVLLLRLLGLATLGIQAALGYAFLRRRADHLASAVISIATVVPMGALLGLEISAWNVALILVLGALVIRDRERLPGDGRSSLIAGLLLGGAFLARLDVGGYALLSMLLLPGRRFLVIGFALVALPFGLLVLATTPIGDAYEQLVWYPLVGPREFRGLPAPTLDDLISIIVVGSIFLLPRVAIALSAIRLVVARRSWAREAAVGALTVFAALCQLQTQGRADAWHYAQASAPGLLLLGTVWGWSVPSRPSWRAVRLAAIGAASLTFILASIGLGLIRAPATEADRDLVAAVRTIRAATTRDEPIFVGLTSNRFTFSNPLLAYYLADRRAGVRVTMYNPGVTNTDRVQDEMVASLDRSGTRLLLLDRSLAEHTESGNASAIPGSTILDDAIGRSFEVACEYGETLVYARRGSGAVTCVERGAPSTVELLTGR
jgi:hypothetical protein